MTSDSPDRHGHRYVDGAVVRRSGPGQQAPAHVAAGALRSRTWGARPVEREREIEELRKLIAGLRGSAEGDGETGTPHLTHGTVVAYEAEAGLGKTTMVEQARELSANAACTVLLARGSEHDQHQAFSTARHLFRQLMSTATEEERTTILGERSSVLSAVVPWHHEQGAEGQADERTRPQPDRSGIHEALNTLMQGLTDYRGPVVLVVDDAHWADIETMHWLVSFTRRVEQYPVLVVLTWRPEEDTPVMPLLRSVRSEPRTVLRRLSALSAEGTAMLVTSLTEGRADGMFCEALHHVTSGQPHLVIATLMETLERRLPPTASTAGKLASIAAATHGEGLTARLESMGPACLKTARAVAVLAGDAHTGRIAELAGLTTLEVGEACDRLRRAYVLADTVQPGFVHPLTGAAVYQCTPAGERNAAHTRAARFAVRDGLGPRAAAVHLLRTHPCGDPWVVDQLRDAARVDLASGAPDIALRYLQRALIEPPQESQRAATLYELGNAAFLAAPDRAIPHLEAALAADGGDRLLHERIVILLARAKGYGGDVGGAVELLSSEAMVAPAHRSRLRLQAEHFLWALMWMSDTEANKRARRLRNLASRLNGGDRTEGYLLGMRAFYGVVRGDPVPQVLQYADRAWGVRGMSWLDEEYGFEVPVLVAMSFMYCDDPLRSERLFRDGINQLHRQGWFGAQLAYAHTLLGLILFRMGRLGEALDETYYSLELIERVTPDDIEVPVRWYAVGQLIQILVAQGRLDAAAALARRYRFGEPFPDAVCIPEPRAVRGELRLAHGRFAEAASDFGQAGRTLDARGQKNPAWCAWQPGLAQALSVSSPQEARRIARRAFERAQRFGVPSVQGKTLSVLGTIIRGREGLDALETALMWLEPSPARYEHALTLVEYGTMLTENGFARDAREALRDAYGMAQDCDSPGLAERAQHALGQSGGLPGPRRTEPMGPLLTLRQHRVARLAADGVDLRDIAEDVGVEIERVQHDLALVCRKLRTGLDGLSAALDTHDENTPFTARNSYRGRLPELGGTGGGRGFPEQGRGSRPRPGERGLFAIPGGLYDGMTDSHDDGDDEDDNPGPGAGPDHWRMN